VLPGRKLGLRGTRLGALHSGKLTGGVILWRHAVMGRRHGEGPEEWLRRPESGRGGAPWRCGTHGGVREQLEEAPTGGVLAEEDDGGGTPVAAFFSWCRG
jgi:hypothetical protein